MSSLSTHVLDTGLGVPAAGVPVRLYAGTALLGSGVTDADGRVGDFRSGPLSVGVHQLHFDIAAYAVASGQELFFPEITVAFTISAERHYHVPLLLSPFAYSTYRGS